MFQREEEGRKNIIKVPPKKPLAYYWRVTCLGREKTHMWLHSKPLILTSRTGTGMMNPLGCGDVFWGIQGSLAVPGSAEKFPSTLSSSSRVSPHTANPSSDIYTIPQPHRKFTARLPKFLIPLLMPSPGGICPQTPHSKTTVTVPSLWPQGHAPNCDMQPSLICNFNFLKGWQQKSALKMEKEQLFQLAKDPQHL